MFCVKSEQLLQPMKIQFPYFYILFCSTLVTLAMVFRFFWRTT
ncbi:hypothetical protein DDI_2169 [Dickeya dianthicola RNS04.9]|nr:hypothetical protein DDI_2169 [Dickeya dianthicola RNS04.9]